MDKDNLLLAPKIRKNEKLIKKCPHFVPSKSRDCESTPQKRRYDTPFSDRVRPDS